MKYLSYFARKIQLYILVLKLISFSVLQRSFVDLENMYDLLQVKAEVSQIKDQFQNDRKRLLIHNSKGF